MTKIIKVQKPKFTGELEIIEILKIYLKIYLMMKKYLIKL